MNLSQRIEIKNIHAHINTHTRKKLISKQMQRAPFQVTIIIT